MNALLNKTDSLDAETASNFIAILINPIYSVLYKQKGSYILPRSLKIVI